MLISAKLAVVSTGSNKLILFIHAILTALAQMVNCVSQDHCYTDIGCFPLSSEFYHPRHRPFNVRPWHRRHIKTQFELFNRHHPDGYMLIPWNGLNLGQSRFDPMLETKVIIPGWLDNINRALWVKRMRDALLWMWAPVNIIVVRWRNFTPYTMATANTRVVGAELANLIRFLEHELQYDRAYYHLIGHSLGAHIGGYAGDRVAGLGRISALDPARPFFQGMPKSVRLDRGDAKFVDAIHSDFTPENAIFLLMSFGMTTPVGHVDFYPNGPPLLQPGCLRDTLTSVQDGIAKGLRHNSLSVAFLEATRYLTACDHQRSHEWFIESITNRQCMFVGIRCSEFEGIINGRCTCDDSRSACAIMGIHADQMYLHGVHEDVWPLEMAPWRSAPSQISLTDFEPLYFEPEHSAAGAPFDAALKAPHLHEHATRESVYLQLRQQIELLSQRPEPQAAPQISMAKQAVSSSTKRAGPRPENGTLSTARATDATKRSDQLGSELRERRPASGASEPEPSQRARLAENRSNAMAEQQQLKLALEDTAFIQYLRSNLLEAPAEQQAQQQASRHNSAATDSESNSTSPRRQWRAPSDETIGRPGQFAGHPTLLSSMHRDTENWYEGTSRWHLKTNNRPNYCSNQYQLMVFVGPLSTLTGRDRLRANLVVSLVGTRGQLLNQRFVPRGSTLNSFTMQPFFILLEGAYSLGQIHSVAVAWEARADPDPIQATITFHSPALEAMQARIPAYKARNYPWLPKTMVYDRSRAFKWGHTKRQPRCPDRRVFEGPNCKHRSSLSSDAAVPKENIQLGMESERIELNNKLEKKMGQVLEPLAAQQSTEDALVYDYEDSDYDSAKLANSEQLSQTANDRINYRDEESRARQKHYVADEDESMLLSPLLASTPTDQLVPINKLTAEDALGQLDLQTKLHLHNLNLISSAMPVQEDTIVINRVIVSPVQPTYGRYGRTAGVFCPPGGIGQKLSREQTIKLMPSLLSSCHTAPILVSTK